MSGFRRGCLPPGTPVDVLEHGNWHMEGKIVCWLAEHQGYLVQFASGRVGGFTPREVRPVVTRSAEDRA